MDESGTTRVTVEEAARLLGIEKQSVKKRVQRGKLRSQRDASGTLWVWVDTSETVQDGSETDTGTVRDELVETLRDEVTHLRRESERKDTIIMSLSQSNAEMSRTIRALEAPAQPPDPAEATEGAAQGVAEDAPGPAPPVGAAGAQIVSSPAVKSSRQVVTETVASGLILAGALALAKVLLPAIVAVGAFVFAGVAASNGESVASFLSAVLGLVGAVLSLIQYFVTYRRSLPFEYHFTEHSWAEREDGDKRFTLEILKSEHGKGNSPTATVYHPKEGGYEEIIAGIAGVEIRPSGTVLIRSAFPFDGKAIIR